MSGGLKFDTSARPLTPEIAQEFVRRSLWIVGSGTWQEFFSHRRKGGALGFHGTPAAVNVETIASTKIIHAELLHRFNSDVVFVDYPSDDETEQILESTGITALAKQLGVPVSPKDVDWSHGGMRVLETIATRLALRRHQNRRDQIARLREIGMSASRCA